MKELYIGFKDDLCFVRPNNQKGRTQVDNWRDKSIEPKIVLNEPQTGYTIQSINNLKRHNYGTSYKKNTFTVFTRYGYKLWISPDNLMELITNCTITHGDILDPLLFDDKCNLTTTELVEDKKEKDKEKYLKQSDIKVMESYNVLSENTTYLYLGKKRLINLLTKEVESVYCYISSARFWYTKKNFLVILKTPKKFSHVSDTKVEFDNRHFLSYDRDVNFIPYIENGDSIQTISIIPTPANTTKTDIFIYTKNEDEKKIVKLNKNVPLHCHVINYDKDKKEISLGEHLVIKSYSQLQNVNLCYQVIAKDGEKIYNVNISKII